MGLDIDWLNSTGDELRGAVLEALEKQEFAHVKVERARDYAGNSAEHSAPQARYVPLSMVEAAKNEPGFTGTDEDAVDAAFRKHTKMDSMHIVSADVKALVTSDGRKFINVADYERKRKELHEQI